jgi:hypothetical protein
MSRSTSGRRARPRLETLEDRCNPSPVHLTTASLPGANTLWNNGVYRGSPLAVDINGDGKDELIVTGGDGNLYAYDLVNNQAVIVQTYVTQPGIKLQSTPCAVDVPGIGRCLFIGSSAGLVFGWNAQTGALLPGWPESVYPGPPFNLGVLTDVFGGVAAGDLDGDGLPEIVVCDAGFETTAFHINGSLYWRYNNDESITTTPAIGDIDGDGHLDVVIGGDLSPGPNYWAGGRVQALTGDGHLKWVKRVDGQIVQSSPVLADIYGNGKLETFIGTGFYQFDGFPVSAGSEIFGLDPNGNDLPGWPFQTEPAGVDGRVQAAPVVADLQGNGELDVIVADAQTHLFAIRPNGQALWTNTLSPTLPDFIYGSPVVADVNGDGKPDVITTNGVTDNFAFDGATGAQVWEERAGNPSSTAYVIGHLRGDATYQMALVSDGPQGAAQGPSQLDIWDLGSSSLMPPWSGLRQDAFNNAVARPDAEVRGLTTDLFRGLLGRDPSTAELNSYVAQMLHAPSLKPFVQGIVSSQEARTRLINGWYQAYLGRPAEPAGVANWISALVQGSNYASIQASIVGSPEAYIHAGNTDTAWVRFLYEEFLGRDPVGSENAYWLSVLAAGVQTREQIALTFVLTPESATHELVGWYQTFAPGGLTFPPEEDVSALRFDLTRGRPEEQLLPNLIVSGGDYVTTQLEGAFVRASYQDLLGRPAGTSDLVFWERAFEQGTTLVQYSQIIAGSSEYHQQVVRGWFVKDLGRQASPADLALFAGALDHGARFTQIQEALVRSDEYWNQPAVAGDPLKFMTKIIHDLLDRDPFAGDPAIWLSLPNIRQQMPEAILGSAEFYQHTVDSVFFQLLRRWGQTPSDHSRRLQNNQVFPPQVFVDYLQAGGSLDGLVVDVLASGEYQTDALNKAFWTGARWFLADHP